MGLRIRSDGAYSIGSFKFPINFMCRFKLNNTCEMKATFFVIQRKAINHFLYVLVLMCLASSALGQLTHSTNDDSDLGKNGIEAIVLKNLEQTEQENPHLLFLMQDPNIDSLLVEEISDQIKSVIYSLECNSPLNNRT